MELHIEIEGSRPPFTEVAHILWGEEADFDSDGNSDTADSVSWTELTLEKRPQPGQRIDIDPVSSDPLVLKVISEDSELVQKVADFLISRCPGKIISKV